MTRRISLACVVAVIAGWMIPIAAHADTTFTYQGELRQSGELADGAFNMDFSLWDAASGGGQIGAILMIDGVQVTEGRFTVELDFGAESFDNSGRWLEIEVSGVTLSPRQPMARTPYAIQTRGILVDENENVGIGTSTPGWPLDVVGRIQSRGSGAGVVTRNPNNDLASVSLNWANDVARIRVGGNGPGAGDGLDIQGLGSASLLRILNSGSVGIGTTNPVAKLQVTGDGSGSVLRLTNGGSCASMSNTALIIGDVCGTGRATSIYGVTSSELINCVNDGIGEGAKFVSRNGNTIELFNVGTGNGLDVTESGGGIAVRAINQATSGSAYGVFAVSESASGIGAYGQGKVGIHGFSATGGFDSKGVQGISNSTDGVGVHGRATAGDNSAGVLGTNTASGWAGYFEGPVRVEGNFFVTGSKNFIIDNPLSPADEYLQHACVESDAMRNLYDGTVALDERGEAVVELPAWFEKLNAEFRYQLTCIGGHAPVYVGREIENNTFTIAGGTPGLKVSWQVTGVRIDPSAQAVDFQVIKPKSEKARGTYLCPEGYGQPASMRTSLFSNESDHAIAAAAQREKP